MPLNGRCSYNATVYLARSRNVGPYNVRMSKPIRGYPFEMNATSVGHQVAGAITSDPNLEDRTLGGVFDQGGARLRVFRQSGDDHDLLSCEIYARQGDDWIYQRKDGVKYVPPEEFKGNKIEIDGVPFWSTQPISAEQIEMLRKLIRRKVG